MKNNSVNLFFACDDGYIPFLAVTLLSIREHRDVSRDYHIVVLNTGIKAENRERILASLSGAGFDITFRDISPSLERIGEKLHTRDYYTKSTYYRLFIPALYPELDKALYLDCDIVLCADVAALYDTALGDALVGAVTDGFVKETARLHGYVTERIGVKAVGDYFNAGVLLMNLAAMREYRFEERFVALLSEVKFDVAQDQDYLNALCRGRCAAIGDEWNCMPGFCGGTVPKLVHYNLDSKPWHKDGVAFADIFWQYSDRTAFAAEIRGIRKEYRDEARAAAQTASLIDLAAAQGAQARQNRLIGAKIERICG